MYRIGVDIGGTNVAVGLVDEDFRLVKKKSTPTAKDDPAAIADAIASLTRELLAEIGATFDEVAGLGIGYPGIVDDRAGVAVYANNLGFRDFPFAAELQKRMPIAKIHLGNDANAAALGEAKAGAARGAENVIVITLGTGVGGGIIIGGRLYTGANDVAGELGHMVIERGGVPCSCGRRGCFEAYASATALVRMTKEALDAHPESAMHALVAKKNGKVSGRVPFDAARAGDAAAQAVIDKYLSYLALGISNLINIFQPEVVVIGGGISGEGEKLTEPLTPIVLRECYGNGIVKMPVLRTAILGNDAGIIGAACLGM